jgi:O-methyltransferase
MPADDLYAVAPADVPADECYFYHAMDIPDHGVVTGDWDLRAHEDEYLGGVELDGRRVLEIGPASGFLTFHMEGRGAEVVAVDLPEGGRWDMVPHSGLDGPPGDWLEVMRAMRNGFWFAHRRRHSAAKVHYGSVYDLPAALGRFDVGVMAAVLLHVRDPLAVVEQCARLCDRIVITDAHVPELDGQPVQQLFPTLDFPQWHTWWRFSPQLFTQFLEVLGFETEDVTFHEQLHTSGGVDYPIAMMTIVARRSDDAC